jgi:N-acylneuraminate cytidylyltransferase
MKYIALICARGGSKRLPNKNIKKLHGIPLIGRAILAAKNIDRIDRIIISTDSHEIAEIAREYGAEVPFMRPDELARDDSPELLSWRHALDYLSEHDNYYCDGLVVIPVTSPLRYIEDIDNCIDEYEKGNVDMVVTVTESYRNPFFNMVKNGHDNLSVLVNNPAGKVLRKQDAPEVFDLLTVAYVAKPEYVYNNEGVFNGRVRSVYVPIERSLDIDLPMHFKIAECLFNENLDPSMRKK